MKPSVRSPRTLSWCAVPAVTICVLYGCKTPAGWREHADKRAYAIIEQKQKEALGRTEPFTIETPADTLRRRLMLGQQLPYTTGASLNSKDVTPIKQWPDPKYFEEGLDSRPPPPWSGEEPIVLSLLDALQVAARNSREYQTQKELVFQSALALDLENHQFETQWAGVLSSGVIADLGQDPDVTGSESTAAVGFTRRFKNGALLAVNLGIDLAKLLSMDKASSLGPFADATIAIPLMRGSGEFVVTEPLKQADRDVVYAIYTFERFKRVFSVRIATEYYGVLQFLRVLQNEQENYEWLAGATRRARRMAEAGRLPEIQVDQTRQDELRARDSWVAAIQAYQRALDGFKLVLGLPVDAKITLDERELVLLAESMPFEMPEEPLPDERVRADAPVELVPPSREAGGPLEIAPEVAVVLALQYRLDLRVAVGRVFDSQRKVAVAADNLRADLTLFGSASLGGRRVLSDAGLPDADLSPNEGTYSAFLTLDLPLERWAERNLYRNSLINFEQIVRDLQLLEGTVKFEVRDDLRVLTESRERLIIQIKSVALAERRVESTSLFLRAGRAQARDVLEAQSDLVASKNDLSFELIRYRVAELALQRDLGLLEVNQEGLWTELDPDDMRLAPSPGLATNTDNRVDELAMADRTAAEEGVVD